MHKTSLQKLETATASPASSDNGLCWSHTALTLIEDIMMSMERNSINI